VSNDFETPDRILDAAEALFARQGFTATTIKQIGVAAGMNPALIYYYFGSKETLYRELLRRLFGWFMGEAGRRIDASLSPDAAVRALIGGQSDVLAARPAIPRLLVREMMDHGAEHAGEQILQLKAGLFARLCALIEQGQEAGIFRRDLNPRFAAISAVSLVPYVHVAAPAVGILLERGPDGPTREDLEAYGRHAADFVLAALAAPGRTGTEEGG
jgi:AcrR family transcriptional regulator